ncbi:MAG: hypothetical protein IPJ61_18965 [Tessaracoccus sp.]|uniref:hypothetical protein n=1 Tax=Tessaracoccus sp. TaxID=1971211 RepID=UPI001ED3B621|nr:hypothetical protein [Tessaracoccus sp.]MBK7823068.1 hypothetical protein [Tessaracoccus sp.]
MPINGLGISGGGFSGGGFGRASGEPVQFLGDAGGAGAPLPSAQAAGVANWGAHWASNKCSSCNTAILEMQNQINRAAAAFGVPIRLVIDGWVGPRTVSALQGVAQAVMGRYATVGLELRAYTTMEAVAKNADTIRDKVKQVADAAGVPPVASAIAATAPALPAASTTPMPTTISPPGSFDMATMPAAGLPLTPVSKWRARAPYIIGGVLVAAGLGAAAYILTRPARAVQGADDNDEE